MENSFFLGKKETVLTRNFSIWNIFDLACFTFVLNIREKLWSYERNHEIDADNPGQNIGQYAGQTKLPLLWKS